MLHDDGSRPPAPPPVPPAPPAALPPAPFAAEPPEAAPEAGPAPAPEAVLAPKAESESGAMPGPAPAPGPVFEAGPMPGAESGAAGRPRRRRRTTLLIASAAVLGVLAGGGLGYRVQYERTPTPLPPLTGPALAQPTGPAPLAPSLTAADDRAVGVYDADLLSLLSPTPKGATEIARNWVSLLEYADEFHDAGATFREFAEDGYRRGASALWKQGKDAVIQIELTQFRDDRQTYTYGRCQAETNAAESNPEYGDGVYLDSAESARVWPSDAPVHIPGHSTEYEGRGVACVGTIAVLVLIDSPRPVKAAVVAKIVNEQVGRL